MAEILSGTKFKCAFCNGSGIQPRSLRSRCFSCRGKGEVEFDGPVIKCPSCQGRGRVSNASLLFCIRCKGVGVIKKIDAIEKNGMAQLALPKHQPASPKLQHGEGGEQAQHREDVVDIIGKRLAEITKRLRWTKKETEKKTKEIEKRLKPIKPFIKEVKKETVWFENLGNKIKEGWESLWKQ